VLAAAAGARLLLVSATLAPAGAGPGADGAKIWCLVELDAPGVTIEPLASLDLTGGWPPWACPPWWWP